MMDNQQDGRVPAAPGSREPEPLAGPALSGFDPSRIAWIYTRGVAPDFGLRAADIWALGRYGDVFGPIPGEMIDPEAWRGNMGGAAHDLVAYAVCGAELPENPVIRFADRLREASRWCSGNEPSLSVLQRLADEAADRIEDAELELRHWDDGGDSEYWLRYPPAPEPRA